MGLAEMLPPTTFGLARHQHRRSPSRCASLVTFKFSSDGWDPVWPRACLIQCCTTSNMAFFLVYERKLRKNSPRKFLLFQYFLVSTVFSSYALIFISVSLASLISLNVITRCVAVLWWRTIPAPIIHSIFLGHLEIFFLGMSCQRCTQSLFLS